VNAAWTPTKLTSRRWQARVRTLALSMPNWLATISTIFSSSAFTLTALRVTRAPNEDAGAKAAAEVAARARMRALN